MSDTNSSSPAVRQPVSAVVISYNRENLIAAVLQSVQFCDEVILVDKSSTDGTRDVALPLCDKLVQVDWSPTVEETRTQAVALAAHDWIVMLDDDEILNPAAVEWIKKELQVPRAQVYGLPQRHYIMGVHDPDAYYWPEHQIRFFNRNAISFTETVHGGIQTDMDAVHYIALETGAGIEHLSHPDVASWIAKANRYTSRLDRVTVQATGADLIDFASQKLAYWVGRSHIHQAGDYPQAAALLRALYDMIDRLKIWEQENGGDGAVLFTQRADELCRQHRALSSDSMPERQHMLIDKSHASVDGALTGQEHTPGARQSDAEAATKRILHLEAALSSCKATIPPLRQELTKFQLELNAVENDRAYYKNLAVVRIYLALTAQLARHPRLLWFISRMLRSAVLLRQGKFLAHLREYLACQFRAYNGLRVARLYQKECLARIDPDGILRSPQKLANRIRNTKLGFSVVQRPVVSVIIPCYGKVEYTLRCLYSLLTGLPSVTLEILVVEDASGDPEAVKLRDIPGIRYIERAENVGFLRSCNDAAQQARGDYLFLLNNDTYVLHGAIDALYDLLRRRPDAGMVGARLLYPDGIQQEAGCIVWQDGSAWNYGRRDTPFRSEYCYVREADYISGAAIMLSRDLWQKLKGFDEHYLPAYCEDSDLAFRVRQMGLKVLYQPDAWVIHDEGVSHGTDINVGIKSYQVANTKKFRERWNGLLEAEHFPSGTHLMRARDRAARRKITLVIDHYIPEPDRDAGSRSILSLIETLMGMGRIIKFWPDNAKPTPGYCEALQQRGVEILCGRLTGGFARWIAANGADIDEVLLSRPTVAPDYIPLLRKHTHAPLVFYGHDLHHARMNLEADITKDLTIRADAAAMREKEIAVWNSVDYTLYPSQEEADAVHRIAPAVAAGFVSPYTLPPAAPRQTAPPADAGILFVAGFAHTPNVDAAVWFVNHILPLIRAEKPDVRLLLVGSRPTDAVKRLASASIQVTGAVSDRELAAHYASARVAISPLRFGAGVKFKVIEAMHKGLPLVTTPIGAQGLENLDGALDIALDEASFAQAVLRFLNDDRLWLARSAAQADYVNRTFSAQTQARQMEQAYEEARKNMKNRIVVGK